MINVKMRTPKEKWIHVLLCFSPLFVFFMFCYSGVEYLSGCLILPVFNCDFNATSGEQILMRSLFNFSRGERKICKKKKFHQNLLLACHNSLKRSSFIQDNNFKMYFWGKNHDWYSQEAEIVRLEEQHDENLSEISIQLLRLQVIRVLFGDDKSKFTSW